MQATFAMTGNLDSFFVGIDNEKGKPLKLHNNIDGFSYHSSPITVFGVILLHYVAEANHVFSIMAF